MLSTVRDPDMSVSQGRGSRSLLSAWPRCRHRLHAEKVWHGPLGSLTPKSRKWRLGDSVWIVRSEVSPLADYLAPRYADSRHAAGALGACRDRDRRRHSSRASRSWIRNGSRGGLPREGGMDCEALLDVLRTGGAVPAATAG